MAKLTDTLMYWEKVPDTPEARKMMKGWVYEVDEDSDYNEDANRVWVTIIDVKSEDWVIGGHTDWLRAYESALKTLGKELKPR
jgi:hypothetical protein